MSVHFFVVLRKEPEVGGVAVELKQLWKIVFRDPLFEIPIPKLMRIVILRTCIHALQKVYVFWNCSVDFLDSLMVVGFKRCQFQFFYFHLFREGFISGVSYERVGNWESGVVVEASLSGSRCHPIADHLALELKGLQKRAFLSLVFGLIVHFSFSLHGRDVHLLEQVGLAVQELDTCLFGVIREESVIDAFVLSPQSLPINRIFLMQPCYLLLLCQNIVLNFFTGYEIRWYEFRHFCATKGSVVRGHLRDVDVVF